jgi:histidinol-phosphatase (PHP family)
MVNYHNHTNLCGHASGTMEDYVSSAINKSLQEFGFSDHATVPLHLRDGIS